MPTLYIFPVSQPSRACMWFAEYAGLKDIELKNVNILAGEQKAPEYVAKFPAAQVPALEDGDFCLAESTAILPYLAEGHDIMPKDKKGLARLTEYFGKHPANIRKVTLDLVRPVVGAKSKEEVEAAVPKAMEGLTPILEKYDALLGKQAFILGDELSLADFLFATEVDQLAFVDAALLGEKYPNIAKYLAKLTSDVAGYAKNFATAAEIVKGVSAARGF